MTLPAAPSPRRLLLRTISSNPDHNGDLDLGIVELTPALAALIRERHRQVTALAATDRQFHSASWFEVACSFVGVDLDRLQELRPEIHRALGDRGWALLDGDLDHLGLEPQRTEGDLVAIDERSVGWSARPKHTDVTVETVPVPIALFIEAAMKVE